jgi:hypothetical protein
MVISSLALHRISGHNFMYVECFLIIEALRTHLFLCMSVSCELYCHHSCKLVSNFSSTVINICIDALHSCM